MIPIPANLQAILRRIYAAQTELQQWDSRSPHVVREQRPQRNFSLDGVLMGDLGQVLAERFFELRLVNSRREGCNARLETEEQETVEILTSVRENFQFRRLGRRVIILLFLEDHQNVEVLYNGTGDFLAERIETLQGFQETNGIRRYSPYRAVTINQLRALPPRPPQPVARRAETL